MPKFKPGDIVDFLHIDKETKRTYYQKQAKINNSNREGGFMFTEHDLKDPEQYYFVNQYNQVQCVWIPAERVFKPGTTIAETLYA